MKKIIVWALAALTSLVSLAAMLIFDFILSAIYYLMGKVPFLSDIVDFIGGILDLGLTILAAAFIVSVIWDFGYGIIVKILGQESECAKDPVSRINNWFLPVAIAAFVFLGVKFVMLIGGVVTAYTAGYEGLTQTLMFFKAIKDAAGYVCGENLIIYKIGANSLILFVLNIINDRLNEKKKD